MNNFNKKSNNLGGDMLYDVTHLAGKIVNLILGYFKYPYRATEIHQPRNRNKIQGCKVHNWTKNCCLEGGRGGCYCFYM